MLKIMLSAVGLRDPYGKGGEKSEGPILGAVRELEPDILFLFPTRRQPGERLNFTEENSRATVAELAKLFPKIKVYERPLNLPDPTDYVKIIKNLREEIDSIKESYAQSKVQYYIALSSGTPQIQSAFLVLVNSNKLRAEVYQTINPDFTKEGERRTRLVETHFLEEENQIVRARSFFRNINYEEACKQLIALGAYTVYPEREQKANVFCDLVEGYFFWDLYQHEQALEKLSKVLPDLKRYRFYKLHEIVAEQAETLQKICDLGGEEDYLNLVDLYHNALRREKCKQYIDCLSRFKRLYEGIYYYIARTQLGIPSPSTKVEQQPVWVKNIIRKNGYLNTYDISKLYKEKKGTGKISKELENQLNQIAQQRNLTINNHGMKSVDKKDARKSMELIEKLFGKVFVNQDIKNYCFSQERMQEVEELLFNEL